MTSNKKKALITGITGQIGSYLAELLMEKGYEVYGLIRKKLDEAGMKVHKENGITVFEGDLDDPISIERVIKKVEPDEIYNLAAQSDAQVSFHLAEYTLRINGMALIRICEAARSLPKPARVFQAASAELYGGMLEGAVDENAPFHPRNPYGIAKLTAYWIVRYYREKHGLFACNGIFFNAESPKRGENFVTRKIVQSVAAIKTGKQERFSLGNLNAMRDWSHAKDFAEAIWTMLQADKGDDYVVASGTPHGVREFVELAFGHVGIEIKWRGSGVDEVGYDVKTNKTLVYVDSAYYRPHELQKSTFGNANKLKALGWTQHYDFSALVKEMIEAEMNKT